MIPLRVGIVGGGIGGLATAWALARRGHAVTIFEQGPIPNPVGSSHDEHRIIRHAYGAMRGYALMMPDAFAAWARLWADLGQSFYAPAPATYCLRMDFDWYEPVAFCLDRMGIAYRDIPLETVATTLPMVNRDGLLRVVETQGAGLLLADRIVRALAAWLPSHGVTLRPRSEVREVDAARGRVRTDAGWWAGDAVVVAAGAWVGRLIAGVAHEFRPSVQTVAYVEPPADLAAAWQAAPLLLNRLPTATGGVYVLPPRAGTRLKIGDYTHTFLGDPAALRIPLAVHVDALCAAARCAIADWGRYRVIETKSCFYTVTPDERFVLRPIGAKGWLLGACSGHGFKFGALLGEAAADAVTGARSSADVADWVAGRLTEPSARLETSEQR